MSPLVTGQPVAMTGYLRFPEKVGLLTASPSRDKRLWFSRDIGEMANSGVHDFTPPSHGENDDWVLVLDAAAR